MGCQTSHIHRLQMNMIFDFPSSFIVWWLVWVSLCIERKPFFSSETKNAWKSRLESFKNARSFLPTDFSLCWFAWSGPVALWKIHCRLQWCSQGSGSMYRAVGALRSGPTSSAILALQEPARTTLPECHQRYTGAEFVVMTLVAMLRWAQSEAKLSLKEIRQYKPVRRTYCRVWSHLVLLLREVLFYKYPINELKAK